MVRLRKELDPKLWHIGRLDLAIEGCSRILGTMRCCGQDRTRCQNGYDTICAAESHFCKGKVVWAQLCADRRKLQWKGCDGLNFEQDWADHRLISRSSAKPERAGDCIMNESWIADPVVVIGDVAFVRMK